MTEDAAAHRQAQPEAEELLEQLMALTPADGTGVDSLAFRASRMSSKTAIDRLVKEHFIRQLGERYHLGLKSIVKLCSPIARSTVVTGDKLLAVLKSHYQVELRKPLTVAELSDLAGVPRAEASRVLQYMMENSVWNAGTSISLTSDDAFVQVAEAVLEIDSFVALASQLDAWRKDWPRQGDVAPALGKSGERSTFSEGEAISDRRQQRLAAVPVNLQRVLAEVYQGLAMGQQVLPIMGARAAIELVCDDKVGDHRTFDQKLDAMVNGAFLSPHERIQVSEAINAGHATIHRGHVPSHQTVQDVLAICERLVDGVYVHPTLALRLKGTIPPRKGKNVQAKPTP